MPSPKRLPTEADHNPRPPPNPPRTILLIDDDAAVCESLRRVLVTEGWNVITADGGESALIKLHAHTPDLIVTDLCMAVIDGWDLLFHQRLEYPALPIFVISALPASATGGADQFATAYFQKPLNLDELVAAIRHHLDAQDVARPPH